MRTLGGEREGLPQDRQPCYKVDMAQHSHHTFEKRVIPGREVPTGAKRWCWECPVHGQQNGGTWKAPDGEKGTWCYPCSLQGVKTPMVTVQVDATRWERGYTEVKCCGRWLRCSRFTNTCERCETDYNGSGQRLAPREFWGEETGETVDEILRADVD